MARMLRLACNLLVLRLPVSVFVDIAGAWYGGHGMRYVLSERMFAPCLDDAGVGLFVGLQQRKVTRIEVFSFLQPIIELARSI